MAVLMLQSGCAGAIDTMIADAIIADAIIVDKDDAPALSAARQTGPHMWMTHSRPATEAERERARQLAHELREGVAIYRDNGGAAWEPMDSHHH